MEMEKILKFLDKMDVGYKQISENEIALTIPLDCYYPMGYNGEEELEFKPIRNMNDIVKDANDDKIGVWGDVNLHLQFDFSKNIINFLTVAYEEEI